MGKLTLAILLCCCGGNSNGNNTETDPAKIPGLTYPVSCQGKDAGVYITIGVEDLNRAKDSCEEWSQYTYFTGTDIKHFWMCTMFWKE